MPQLNEGEQLELIESVCKDSETARYIFIAQSDHGESVSLPMIDDDSGDSEMNMLADYLAVVSERTGRDREELLRVLISELNEIGTGRME